MVLFINDRLYLATIKKLITLQIWPEWIVNFIDFFKTDAKAFWKHELQSEHEIVPYDGIWIVSIINSHFGERTINLQKSM